jgi:multifunctional beta-oxidation protein
MYASPSILTSAFLIWFEQCDQAKLLHGEQYLKIHGPIPTSATLVNRPKLLEVLDKVGDQGV